MVQLIKAADALTIEDIRAYPVWEYLDPQANLVRPVIDLPVSSLNGRLVGTRVRLQNGAEKWALLCNVALNSRRATTQFCTVKIEHRGEWFELARYFDSDYARRSPDRLAAFLGLRVTEVFPIAYDISNVARGDPAVVKGVIQAEPEERLSPEELVQLALEDG
jgi:hypothetical protein